VMLAELMVLPVAAEHPKAAFAAETGWMSHRLPDFERSRANAGVRVERVSLLRTPAGDITISYLEGSRGYRDVAKTIRTTPTVFDQDMMMRGKVLHGLSEEAQQEKRIPLETVVLRREPVTPRQPWHSFAAQVRPDAVDRWQATCAALGGARRGELEAFARQNGVSVLCTGLYRGDRGTLSCFYLEGSDDAGFLPKAVAAGGPFGSWLADEFAAVHGADLRDGLPSPAVAKPWDWVEGERNEVVAPLFGQVTRLLGE
jgi:hypothetical protein